MFTGLYEDLGKDRYIQCALVNNQRPRQLKTLNYDHTDCQCIHSLTNDPNSVDLSQYDEP